MPVPEANTAWFTLHLNGRTDFEVYAFTGPTNSLLSWFTLPQEKNLPRLSARRPC